MRRFSSLLLSQLVWILPSSAGMIGERTTIPVPIIVEPSQSFDGIDGPFSSFNISVGTPPQTLKVFISTSVWQTLVVVPEGCPPGTQPNCAVSRGGEFFLNESSTWQNNLADPRINIYPMQVDTQLGYSGHAELGFDDVSVVGPAGTTTLKNQTVGGFAVNDSYLGLLGINPRASTFNNTPALNSYLESLRNQSMIPSISWGYTAGNQYHSSPVFGSLTLGGYDRSRFVQHDGSWPIDGNIDSDTNNLAVQLESISVTAGGSSQGLLPTPITAVIDSSLPYLWLPVQACLLFEIAFGLVWNDAAQLYFVNDTLHSTLVQQNASLTFNLGGMTGGSTTNVNITLPYAAFDLTASSPLAGTPTRYYPLKRAANASQYLLGRTFFQEAFVVADYERRNFSVFPCQYEDITKPNIVSILSPSYNITPIVEPGPSGGSPTPTPAPSGGSSNTGAIAGGVVGGIAIIAIIAALYYFFWWRPKRRQDYTTHGEKSEMHAHLPDNPALALEDPTRDKAELAASSTDRNSDVPELEGSAGRLYEMQAREEAASEMHTRDNNLELPTSETASEVTSQGGYFDRSVIGSVRGSVREGAQSPEITSQGGYFERSVIGSVRERAESPSSMGSPLSPGLPIQGKPSPMSGSSPGPSSPQLSLVSPSSVPSPLPSPPLSEMSNPRRF